MGLKEDWNGDSEKVSIWRKRETGLTFPNGMDEYKHSWMWQKSTYWLRFNYCFDFPLTAYDCCLYAEWAVDSLSESSLAFSQRRCELRSLGVAKEMHQLNWKAALFVIFVVKSSVALWVSVDLRGDWVMRWDLKELSSLMKSKVIELKSVWGSVWADITQSSKHIVFAGSAL